SWVIGHPMNLVFASPLDLFAIASAGFIVRAVAADGETTWFEGLLLVGVYPCSRWPTTSRARSDVQRCRPASTGTIEPVVWVRWVIAAITANATSCASIARLSGVANAALAIISSVRP